MQLQTHHRDILIYAIMLMLHSCIIEIERVASEVLSTFRTAISRVLIPCRYVVQTYDQSRLSVKRIKLPKIICQNL